MKIQTLITSVLSFAYAVISCFATDSPLERPDWGKFFADEGVEGTIVIKDERSRPGAFGIFNIARAEIPYSPASTFKVPHALFALDAGVVKDEFQTFSWDGVPRNIASWNHDQDLRSSIRNSVVWVYEKFANEIGLDGEKNYLKNIHYGNADPSGEQPFWINGNLRISAVDQITFLGRLYRNELPFKSEYQRLVKDVMINEAGREWILRAKTGWSGTVGWWIGWVEWPTGPVFFALNIDTPNRMEDLPKREVVARSILRSVKALP